ncbi:unnamed protein product [Moneuplotes crassus]|uniref:Uncharacterized protein n=1 Tax=Euplotes crassus TaxID=5936 RepID=A0AAD1XJG7_EUPCR|nr:unnamed protein product [Moneuplotes crassus]
MFGSSDYTKTQIGMSKPVYYERDGFGRDSYISINNGGLNRPMENGIYNFGSFSSKHTQSMYAPRIECKRVRYKSNGLGRDSYISVNNGGLASNGHMRDTYTNGFLGSLRQPSFPTTPKIRSKSKCKTIRERKDFYISMQSFSNWKQKKASSLFRRYQQTRDETLSKPKRKAKKYCTFRLHGKLVKACMNKTERNFLDRLQK